MSFKFNFSSGAAEDSDSDTDAGPHTTTTRNGVTPDSTLIPPAQHTLASLLPLLPRNISYSFIPTTPALPRRELYDVRMQLMAEDDLSATPTQSVLIGSEDIRTRVYEGGLKSWECSLDLVEHLSGSGVIAEQSLELGCGTGLPSLIVLQELLKARRPGRLVLADYNFDVLRLVTLPNLFLAWVEVVKGLPMDEAGKGDLDACEELREEFLADITARGIDVGFVSGAWGAEMLDILNGEKWDLVMGSETIYSPATMGEFTDVLLGCLEGGGRGLVAAKRIYFGVGGSVEDFVAGINRRNGGWEVKTARDLLDVGVGRVILEVGRTS